MEIYYRVFNEATEEALGNQERRKNDKLWTDKIDKLKQKKILYLKLLNSSEDC